MIIYNRLAIVFASVLAFSSCGGGESSTSSGGSGIGGTGITLVRGNVANVNGQALVYIMPEKTPNVVDYISEWVIPLSFAQAGNLSSLTVSGGGQSSSVSTSGEFTLPDVTPSSNFVLTFTIDNRQNIPLRIGQVLEGAIVTVRNIAIDTNSGSAQPGGIDVQKPVEPDDEDSKDPDDQDDVSEDKTEEEDVDEEDEEDDGDEEDEEDDVSEDEEENENN